MMQNLDLMLCRGNRFSSCPKRSGTCQLPIQ